MILVPIVEKYSSFTPNEQKIADYILDNPQQFLDKNIKQLAEITETSPAAMVRFSRKIGFSGFSDMKIELAKYFTSNQVLGKDIIVNQNDTYSDCKNKILAQISEVCKATANSLDLTVFSKIIKIIDKADTIYLLGVGSSGTAAMELQQKLIKLYKKVFFIQDSQMNLLSMITMNKNDVLIAFSYSGYTKIIEVSVKAAKNHGATVVGIIGNTYSPIALASDYWILTPGIEREESFGAISSRYAQQYVNDLIYLCLACENYADAQEVSIKASDLLADL